MRLIKIIIVLFVVGLLTGCQLAPPIYFEIPFETIERGNYSGLVSPTVQIISAYGDWVILWHKHKSNFSKMSPLLEIDFTKEIVIVIASGQALEIVGSTPEIIKILHNVNYLEIQVHSIFNGRGCFSLTAVN